MVKVDDMVENGWYYSRSEAIRDALRKLICQNEHGKVKAIIEIDIEWGLYGE